MGDEKFIHFCSDNLKVRGKSRDLDINGMIIMIIKIIRC